MHRNARGERNATEQDAARGGRQCERATKCHCRFTWWVIWSASLGQDQLVLRRQPQAIILLAMRDDDLALGREQLAAVDSAAVHGEKASRRRRIFGIFSGASDIIS